MVDSNYNIRYSGVPQFTDSGIDVMAFHLHRFLAGWLNQQHIDNIWVTLGFEDSLVQATTFEVSLHRSVLCSPGWTFEDLCQTYKHGDGHLYQEDPQTGQTKAILTLPVLDRPEMGGAASVLLGFVSLPAAVKLDADELARLQNYVFESICAARRNAVRLFFDEHKSLELKHLLYAFMDHLPEWAGVDHSSMMILTSTLETMTLDQASTPQFNILAERLYTDSTDIQRLVGMNIQVNGEIDHVISQAFEYQRQDVDMPYQIFTRCDADPTKWRSLEPQSKQCHPIHQLDSRGDESMYVLVPLVASDQGERELLGFLCLTYQTRCVLPSSVGQLLADIGEHLAPLLRYSSLYTLSARKLWILRQLRKLTEEHIDGQGDVVSLLERASALIQSHVEVPSVALAYLEADAEQKRHLRFVAPFGWANQEHMTLMVDVPEQLRIDSGVTALAVRLEYPLVLAGGHVQGDQLAFKNSVWVNESNGRLIDERCLPPGQLKDDPQWVPLSQYYTSAREQAYATLAYPIMFGGRTLGAVAVEVDKSTSWFWWTGFGGHLFWQLLASELANAFYVFGVRGTFEGR